MSEQFRSKKRLWGKIASQYRNEIMAFEARRLAKPKQEESEKTRKPLLIENPQKALIQAHMKRYAPTIKRYVANFCMRLLPRNDLYVAVSNETRKMLNNVRRIMHLSVTQRDVDNTVREIIATLEEMMTGLKDRDMEITMVSPIMEAITGKVEEFADYAQNATRKLHDQEAQDIATPTKPDPNDPLSVFPPKIARVIRQRLSSIGMSPNDTEQLKFLIRNLGVDPDEAFEQLKRGIVPEKLRKFF